MSCRHIPSSLDLVEEFECEVVRWRGKKSHKRVSRKQLTKLRAIQFNYECCYCGQVPKLLTLDHFKPKSKGGLEQFSNYLPACSNCNNRKSNSDAFEWYSQQTFFCPKRWAKIIEVLNGCAV